MNQQQWTEVDTYFCNLLVPSDAALDAAIESSDEAGLPSHHVAPNQGKLLQLLAQIQGARNILEIGTLAGYSTIWLSRALPPNGRLVTLECDPLHADVAQANITRAGLSNLVELRLGNAVESLQQLEAEGGEPFDFIFIDADKPSNPIYLAWALKLSRVGTLIIADNVVRNGELLTQTAKMRRFKVCAVLVSCLQQNRVLVQQLYKPLAAKAMTVLLWRELSVEPF
jgi:predicted O-methyltransferase YrrM